MFDFSKARVLCVGDVMLDRFVYGQVDRLSPESPIPILHSKRSFEVIGGAGNVARNLSALGVNVHFISAIGKDHTGQELEKLFSFDQNIKSSLIIDSERQTTSKTRFIAQGQQLLRVDEEQIHPLSPKTQDQILKKVKTLVDHVDVVILSDYAKGVFEDDLCQQIIQEAKSKALIIVDPKGKDFNKYAYADLITPNLKEINEVSHIPISATDDLFKAYEYLSNRYNISALLVTRGPEGMSLFQQEEEPIHIPTQAKEVFDVSGAGDTVIATLAASLASSYNLEQSCRIANAAAGIVVGKAGTATVSLAELNTLYTHSSSHSKIYSSDQLLDLLKYWRREGLKIGFTNGCFDLLHQGHLYLLNQASKICDRLIVAVNSDTSVRLLKGSLRPVHDQATRCEILSNLEMVDAVILFDQSTPYDLIREILPDVLIKGGDYTIENVVGADLVLKKGGIVKLIEIKEGHSTTKTIEKMNS